MRKIIAAINMTLDGFCDHTAVSADDELHEHYNELMRTAGLMIYGRITYQLMENYWPEIVRNPTGNKATDEFAVLMDDIPKIVYSRTLDSVNWKTATLKKEIMKEEVLSLKRLDGKDIFVGSPGMIASFTDLDIIDEYQICLHPVIVGSGLILFKNITKRVDLMLTKTKKLSGGAVTLYYERKR